MFTNPTSRAKFASKTLPLLALFLALMLAACNSGPSPTAPTPVPTEIPTTNPTTTPTVTATPTKLPPGPEVLLEGVRAAMAGLKSAHIVGEIVLKATEEADVILLSVQVISSGNVNGDSQLQITFEGTDFAGTLTYGEREVEGVSYSQDPSTGEWTIDDTDGPADDSFDEILPEGMAATKSETEVLDGLPVYRITGSVPDNPEQ